MVLRVHAAGALRDDRIVCAIGVVGDAQDVEAGRSVEVDDLANREVAVAPRRVCVELREQRGDLAVHLTSWWERAPRGGEEKWCLSSEKQAASAPPAWGMLAAMLGGGDDDALGSADATALVEAAEETLAPLTAARNVAWWDANVDATEANERRRAETELAYSNALSDPELFGAVQAVRGARRTGSRDGAST